MLDTLTLEEQFVDSVLVLTVVIRQRLFSEVIGGFYGVYD